MYVEGDMNPPVDGEKEEQVINITDIGKNLKNLRKKENMSTYQVCEKMKTDYDIVIQKNTLVAYESEKRFPTAKTFLALCDLYHCNNILEYFGLNESEGSSISLNNFDMKSLAELLLGHYGEAGCKELIKTFLDMMVITKN